MARFARASIRQRMLSMLCLFVLTASRALSADAPTVGLLYNTAETQSLSFRCSIESEGLMNCAFVQTSVRKKARPEDLKEKLAEARRQFKEEPPLSAEECKMFGLLVDVLEGRKSAPKADALNQFSASEKEDVLKSTKAMQKFCESKKEADFLAVVELEYDKSLRTCKVSSNTFVQKFRFVHDGMSGKGSWVVKDEPDGPCGVVQLSLVRARKP